MSIICPWRRNPATLYNPIAVPTTLYGSALIFVAPASPAVYISLSECSSAALPLTSPTSVFLSFLRVLCLSLDGCYVVWEVLDAAALFIGVKRWVNIAKYLSHTAACRLPLAALPLDSWSWPLELDKNLWPTSPAWAKRTPATAWLPCSTSTWEVGWLSY